MRFKLSSHDHIWEAFDSQCKTGALAKAREWDSYLRSLDKVVYWDGDVRFGGDQEWLSSQLFDPQEIKNHSYPKNWILSYKAQGGSSLPADCKVMVFHGSPKPEDVNDDFVIQHWKTISAT